MRQLIKKSSGYTAGKTRVRVKRRGFWSCDHRGFCTMPYWAVAMTQPLGERRAILNLERQGFTHYAPMCAVQAVKAGKKYQRQIFLFPRYLFFLVVDQWHVVKNTFGISSIIMDNDKPAQLPDAVITQIKARERNGLVQLPKPHKYAIGERVKITGGLFAGLSGLYQGQTAKQREVVLLDVLGRAELAAGDLE